MTYRQLFLFLIIVSTLFSCSTKRPGNPRVLVFSKTAGFRHSAISNGKEAIIKLGKENGFEVDTTENAAYFTEDSLKNYAAVIFLSTTGNVLDNYQEAAFERYIQAGGGFVGIHAATDTEYDWGWYGRLVGGYFNGHPSQQEADLIVVDQTHISTKHLPQRWRRKDEWYNFKKLDPDLKVLIKIDEKSYEGGTNGDSHPMAWYHDFDGGRAWYTELGHTEESYSEVNYLKHLLGGIQYAVGDNNKTDYSKAVALIPPDENRFTKTNLAQGSFFEPTEMTILPNLDILVTQRRGEILIYKNKEKLVKQAGFLDVYFQKKDGGTVEEGLLGIKADPDFKKNHFIYIFYSPADTGVNRLSRFTFENDTILRSSEKIILQFYSQREICCHTGGSIDFGPDGKTLFVSTGDNSTPFDEPGQQYVNRGYAPLDDRPGHEPYDARRSSGNSNDLRGKILRIKIKDDGTYEIPEGNLFAKGTANTKPEIYVMGNRNPYRIMVDKKNGFLYWGEVGPDSDTDSLSSRGPKGYDELNQARRAGFFGWPLFVGDNYPYYDYDYTTGKTKSKFDPAKPINDSRNNTGIKELPAVQPPFIWYPYGISPDFPQLGTGGRTAMAGPVYYTDMFAEATRLPDYYNKKLFIYEWMRGWIKVVSMKENGDFDKMEPFMQHTKLASVIDMETGPDGKLYLLEYGTGWFTKNPDAGISRIDFNAGNRPPVVSNFKTDKTNGALPFAIKISVDATDPENDDLTYVWKLGNGITKQTNVPSLVYTFEKAGDYAVSVEVKDKHDAFVESKKLYIYAGNSEPIVNIEIKGNRSFYFPGKNIGYTVTISDTEGGDIDTSNLFVAAGYSKRSAMSGVSAGHTIFTDVMTGKNLTQVLDCKSCHKENEKSIGPAFMEVAKKYEKDPAAVNYLVQKILKGGGGVWGVTAMAAHPDLPETDAKKMVAWIRSLSGPEIKKKSLPASGTISTIFNKPVKDNDILTITASYSDKGGNNSKPLTGSNTYSLRNNKFSFYEVKNMKNFTSSEMDGAKIMAVPLISGWFSIDSIDLTGITSVFLMASWRSMVQTGYAFEIRLDAPEGQILGVISLEGVNKTTAEVKRILTVKLQPVTDRKFHNLYIVSKPLGSNKQNPASLQWIEFSDVH